MTGSEAVQGRSKSRYWWLVVSAALFGTLRMAFLGLALPPLAPLDEHAHLDTAWRYADFELPTIEKEHYLEKGAQFGARYLHREWFEAEPSDPWFFETIEQLTQTRPTGAMPLNGELVDPELRSRLIERQPELAVIAEPVPSQILSGYVDREKAAFTSAPNYELFEPPLYYAGAGLWQNLSPMQATPRHDFAWLRMFSALCFGVGVVLFAVLAKAMTRNTTTAILVAWLVACTPQDVFGVVKSDVLGPILYPGILLLALRLRVRMSLGRGVVLGLGVALVWLGKPAFVPALVGVPFVLGRRVLGSLKRDTRARWVLVWSAVAALLPILAWSAYSVAESGDATGANHKVGIMNFQPQTWDGFTTHPIWSLEGFGTFAGTTIARLWRGEIPWHGEAMSARWADWLFLGLTVIATRIGLVAALRRSSHRRRAIARALSLQWLAAFGLLFALSLLWDMREARTHMQGFPFFANGRLIFGAFGALAIFLCDAAVRRFGERVAALVVGAGILALAVFGFVVLLPMLESPHLMWRLL